MKIKQIQSKLLERTCLILLHTDHVANHDVSAWEQLLLKEERDKAQRFKFFKDQKTYTVAHGLLNYCVMSFLGVDKDNLAYAQVKNQKPILNMEGHSLYFNLSHSQEGIALIFSKDQIEVGVDLEKDEKSFDYKLTLNHYFTSNEQAYINNSSDFFRFWTRKETVLKTTGVGLIDDLQQVEVIDDACAFTANATANATSEVHLSSFQWNDFQISYGSLNEPIKAINIYQVTP